MTVSPVRDVRDISRLAYGFIASKALFAALDVDLFGHVDRGINSTAELSQKLGVAENRLSTLLAALTALGLLVHEDAQYSNSPAAARYLVRGARDYFGDYYRLQIDKQIYPALERLGDGLDGRPGQSIYSLIEDPDEAATFSTAQHQGSSGPAVVLSRAVDLAGARMLLDVGGGTGAMSIAICRRYGIDATIIDLPTVIALAKQFVADAGLEDRIKLIAGDALQTEWPGGFDVVLMSYLLSAVGEKEINPLLQKARAALRRGGRLVIHDFMLDADRNGPREAALWFLSYVTSRADTISFSAEELSDRLSQLGFEVTTFGVLIPGITKFIVARVN